MLILPFFLHNGSHVLLHKSYFLSIFTKRVKLQVFFFKSSLLRFIFRS